MIATMRMTLFWTAVEDLTGGATSQKEWIERLGVEWAPAATLLRPTDDRAEELVCPRACEDGCLRRVILLTDGRLRAECGNPSPNCENAVLSEAEVAVLAVDTRKLTAAIRGAINLVGDAERPVMSHAAFIGRHEISPGRGFRVFLYLPQPAFGIDPGCLDLVAVSPPGPRLVLVPTRRSMALREVKRLERHQATIMALEDLLVWDARKGFLPVSKPATLFSNLIEGLLSVEKVSKPTIAVPEGTKWEDVELDLAESQQFDATIRGRRQIIVPHDLAMVKGPLHKPTTQWFMLESFAYENGRLPIGASRAQKQKQSLAEKLNRAFGILDDPFTIESGCYVARFKITANGIAALAARKRRGG